MIKACYTAAEKVQQNLPNSSLLKKGKCRGLWRPEPLPGKCFGLRPVSKEYGIISNPQECRSLCCNLGDQCTSWQFQSSTSTCRMGGVIRLGMEKTGTPAWCDPHPPSAWKGNRLISKQADGTCIWGAALSSQCFGLGDEKMSLDGARYNTNECRAACCSVASVGDEGVTTGCALWQHNSYRGCYYSRKDSRQCPQSLGERYIGGRKCVPQYCGGKEDVLLGQFNTSLPLRKTARHRRND